MWQRGFLRIIVFSQFFRGEGCLQIGLAISGELQLPSRPTDTFAKVDNSPTFYEQLFVNFIIKTTNINCTYREAGPDLP